MPDSASITAVSALIAAIATAGITYMTTRNKAHADEVSMLRDEVRRLQDRQSKSDEEISELRLENTMLYRILRKHGIDVETEMKAMNKSQK